MTDQEKQIKLAEFVGWRPEYKTILDGYWWEPKTQKRVWYQDLPGPLTDANDCHAVIKHLNGLGWHVEIIHYAPDHAEVSIEQHPDGLPVDWEGDNWMHGVCELALEVIENEAQAA